MSVLTPATLARHVAAHGLPGPVQIDQLVSEPLPGDTYRALLDIIGRHRVTGQLMDAVVSGALPATDGQIEDLAEQHVGWCTSMLGLERELLRVADVLETGGIDMIVLKGTAAAHLHYPDPAQRLFGDNDILLRSGEFEVAIELLLAAGYTRLKAPARPDFDRRFGKGATLLQGATELDVHRNLVFGSFGFAIDLDHLWATTTTFEVGGRSLSALGADERFIHAMFHAALGDATPQLGVLRDLAQQVVAGLFDPDNVRRLLAEWRSMIVAKRALHLLDTELGFRMTGPLHEAASAYRPSPREQRALATYVLRNRSFAAKVIASMPYLPSMRERAALLRSVAMPSRDFTVGRGSASLVAWWGRGLRSIARSWRR